VKQTGFIFRRYQSILAFFRGVPTVDPAARSLNHKSLEALRVPARIEIRGKLLGSGGVQKIVESHKMPAITKKIKMWQPGL
jgi:hypothetical protein